MGATPLRAAAAEAASWPAADPGAVADEGTEPPSDTSGSADYRRHLSGCSSGGRWTRRWAA